MRMLKNFLIRGLEMGEIIPFPVLILDNLNLGGGYVEYLVVLGF